MADSLKKIDNHTSALSVPLAIAQREQWKLLLNAFDDNAYRPKIDFLLPSFSTLVSKYCKGKGLALDVGCGSGLLGSILVKEGWKVYGIDILPVAAQMASRYYPSSIASIEELPYPSYTFDLVICSMVLMLVKDIYAAIGEMERVLKHGGMLFLSILNPLYEGDERLKNTKCYSDGAIEIWRFHVCNNHIEVNYYWRSLEYYWEKLNAYFKKIEGFEVGKRGKLSLIQSPNDANIKTEYIWHVAVN